MNRSKKKVEKALIHKGFVLTSGGKHRRFTYITILGRETPIFTIASHSPKMKDLGDRILESMAEECRLTKKQFVELVDCDLSQEDYEKLLVNAGLI